MNLEKKKITGFIILDYFVSYWYQNTKTTNKFKKDNSLF